MWLKSKRGVSDLVVSPDATEGPGKLSEAEQDGEEFVVEELLPVARGSVPTPNLDQGHDHGGEQENSLHVWVRILQRIFIDSGK